MTNSQDLSAHTLPSLSNIKAQAKRLRTKLQAEDNLISHSKALEMLAHQHGFKDWNGLRAALPTSTYNPPNGYHIGDMVQGRYLGQAFKGTLHAVEAVGTSYTRLVIDFDEAVDVVTFDSFSSYRKRVRCVIGSNGRTVEKTSNGEPHLCLENP